MVPLPVKALEGGFEHVYADDDYPGLMKAARFDDVELIDATDEFLATQAQWISAWNAEADELQRAVGAVDFGDRQARRARTLAAVKAGLLRRLHHGGTKEVTLIYVDCDLDASRSPTSKSSFKSMRRCCRRT
jgi:hypothetical protein